MEVGGSSNKVIKNTLFNAISGILIQALSVVTGICIARAFGPGGYGDLSFAYVVVGYFMLGTDFGITAIAIKRVAQDKANFGNYLLTYLIGRFGLSMIAILGLVAVTFYSDFSSITNQLLLVYGLLIIVSVFSVNWLFTAQQRMDLQGICEVTDKLVYTLILVVFLFVFKSVFVVPAAMVVSSIVATCVGWLLIRRNFSRPVVGFDRGFFMEMFVYSWPVGLSNGASRINTNLDTIFLQIYWGSVITGEYNAAYRLIGLLIIAGNFFTSALYPLVCERAIGSKDHFVETINSSTKILLILLVPVSFILMMIGPELLTVLFGKDFVNGGIAVRILSWVPVLLLISRFYGNTLTALNQQSRFMVAMILSAGLNIGLNFALIPRFGMTGAGMATVITEVFILLIALHLISRKVAVRISKPLIQSLASGGAMAVVLHLLAPFSVVVALAVALPLYVIFLFICRAFECNDIRLLIARIDEQRFPCVARFAKRLFTI
jgi:O-antigen/teichoic acid export membrane protein